MLRKHMTVQSREPQHTDKRQSDDRLPLGFPFLSPATSSEEPERSAASAPGPGSAGQDDAAQLLKGLRRSRTGTLGRSGKSASGGRLCTTAQKASLHRAAALCTCR